MTTSTSDLRDTDYAEELARAVLPFPSGDEARVERIRIKKTDKEEIRFSWWKDGHIMLRSLDLAEPDLMTLIARGIRNGVLNAQTGLSFHSLIRHASDDCAKRYSSDECPAVMLAA
jgi:hypothetical protein